MPVKRSAEDKCLLAEATKALNDSRMQNARAMEEIVATKLEVKKLTLDQVVAAMIEGTKITNPSEAIHEGHQQLLDAGLIKKTKCRISSSHAR